MRRLLALLALAIACTPSPAQPAPQPVEAQPATQDFRGFLQELWRDAQAQGVTRATFDMAFRGIEPDPRVMPITRRQPEFGKPFGDYLAAFTTLSRINGGVAKAAELSATFDSIEGRFGVPREIILAIWGVETSYGRVASNWDAIRSLATLAHARFRHPYFRDELIVALKILQDGHVGRDRMKSSWAGAMGQTQFMPSNFLAYAVDQSGDGRRDIWTSIPDILASTGNYLRKSGWTPGLPWGFEVTLPRAFDHRQSRGSFAEWQARGVRRTDRSALPTGGDAILFFPTGASGPAFLITDNFVVIKRYNNSDAYALAVGHLGDRIRGQGAIRTAWPADDRQFTREERIALQRAVAARGYKVRNFTGHFDFDLRDHIRELQAQFGMVADGHPTAALLQRLGAEP
jgi:lytic murein transglycosylase